MNERRLQRLQEQIKERLAEILLRDLADPKLGMVTISRVELDAEFTLCKAYWSVIATSGKGEERARADSDTVLQRARGFCQREVGKSLNTRTIPRLEFVHDAGVAGAVRINQLLKDLTTKPGDPPAAPAAPGNSPSPGS
jgi:ribosome-binding factor A